MQKNGSLTLTRSEVSLINRGLLPERIQTLWGLTLEEVQAKISTQEYVVIDDVPDSDGFGY